MSGQTISFLKRRFEEVGFRLNHRHGQNFLIDLNLLRLLVDTAQLGPGDVVLEVGTGTGGLTALVAPHVAGVVTVEIDAHLHQLASEELADFPHVTLLRQDALKNKNHMNPRVLESVAEQLSSTPGRQLKLVANLPYNIATPVISNLLASEFVPRTMTVTIQKELADRIVAAPSTKDYGALSIWVQSQCRAEIVRILPPSVFWPRPKVSSAFLHIAVDEARRDQIPDRDYFHNFVRALFCHRRKFLRSVLASMTKEWLDKSDVDRILAKLRLNESQRAEELDPETLLALCEAVRSEHHARGLR